MKRIYKQITKRQAGVFYRGFKDGSLELNEEQIKDIYDLVDYDGYDDCGTMSHLNDRLLVALDCFFSGDIEGTNKQLKLAFMYQ